MRIYKYRYVSSVSTGEWEFVDMPDCFDGEGFFQSLAHRKWGVVSRYNPQIEWGPASLSEVPREWFKEQIESINLEVARKQKQKKSYIQFLAKKRGKK